MPFPWNLDIIYENWGDTALERLTDFENKIRVSGRTERFENVLYLCQNGSFLGFSGCISFAELSLRSIATDPSGMFNAYLGIFLDGQERPSQVLEIQPGDSVIPLFQAESPREITIRVVKLTEAQYGQVGVRELRTDGAVSPTAAPKRKLLFIGDSISAGSGVVYQTGDEPFTTGSQDATLAYPWLTARALNAQCHIVAMSGGGLTSRWIPPEAEEPLRDVLMPQMVTDTDLFLDQSLNKPLEPWTPSRFQPDVICVNLGTNDVSYTRGIPERERAFRDAYRALLERLAADYPHSQILSVYGLMEQSLLPHVRDAVRECQNAGIPVSFLALPLQSPADGMGLQDHPSPITHQKAASHVTARLREITGWKEK